MSTHVVKALTTTRAREWKKVFGTDKLPIQSIHPTLAHFPGYVRPQRCYMLDTHRLTERQWSLLILHLAAKFSYPLLWVRTLLPIHGVPILAKGTAIHIATK